MPTRRAATRTVWVSWQSAEGPRNTQGELQALNDQGYAVLEVAGRQTMWIPLGRVYSISTHLSPSDEAAVLEEQTAAEAAAVIEAVAEAPSAPTQDS